MLEKQLGLIFGILLSLIFVIDSAGQEKITSGFIFHSIEKKETIFSISRKYGVTPEEIYRYNPDSREKIKTGDILQIPKKTSVKNSTTHEQQKGKFIIHKVRKGESLYFIAKKYNCTQEEILKLNPGSPSSLKRGMELKIPISDQTAQTPAPQIQGIGYTNYKIVSGDTYFSLKKRFGAEKEELETLNPDLKKGFKAGMIIRIPKEIQKKAETSEEAMPEKTEESITTLKPADSHKQYNVGLYLPFCAYQNDSTGITSRTGNYLEFYEGAMIAAENMISHGMKVKMYVYDTNQDPKVVAQLVKKPEFLSLNLIIGPVFPACQEVISALSAKNRIPMVSPLSSDGRYASSNPYFFQVNPDKKLRLTGTADYVCEEFEGKNIIVVSNGNGRNGSGILTERLRNKVKAENLQIFNIWAEGRSGIESLLNPATENIIVLADEDEARISVAITRLNTYSKKYNIKLIGLQEHTRLQSINVEYLHNLKFHYLSPYFINYNDKPVCDFIQKYRSSYSSEPSQYSFQGYDVMTSFLNNLVQNGNNNLRRNPMARGELLQADYNFQPVSSFGGFVNNSFFIIGYTDNWEVKSSGKIKAGN